MNGRFQMQGGKNWFLPKEMNANRFFWDSHWLEILSNHFYPSMGPNGGSMAMDSVQGFCHNPLKCIDGVHHEASIATKSETPVPHPPNYNVMYCSGPA
jgi:hypothetical protein